MYTEIPSKVLTYVQNAGQSDEAIDFESDVAKLARKHFNRNQFVSGCYSRLYDAVGLVSIASLIGGLFRIKFFKNYSRWKVVAFSITGLFFFRHMSGVSMRLAMKASCAGGGGDTIKEISKGAAWQVPFYFPVRADWATEVMYQVGIPLIKGSPRSVFDHAYKDPETIIYCGLLEPDLEKMAEIANYALRSVGSVESAKALLRLGATVNEAEEVAKKSNGFWWYFCLCRKYELIHFFLEKGADRNGKILVGPKEWKYPLTDLIGRTLSQNWNVTVEDRVKSLLQVLFPESKEDYSSITSYVEFKTYITESQGFKVNEKKLKAFYNKAVELDVLPEPTEEESS